MAASVNSAAYRSLPIVVITPKSRITKPFPGPLMLTLELLRITTSITLTSAAIITDIVGVDCKSKSQPKRYAINDTTKPENRFLGSVAKN